MSLKKLVFNNDDASTIADSANVGAWLRDSAGNLLTSTLNGSDQSLDVNITGSSGAIEVTATNLDIRQLDGLDAGQNDTVGIIDALGDRLEIESDGSINVNATPVDKPIQFRQDGTIVEVLEDTVTPANNQPLPVKLTSLTGDINITAGDLNVQLTHLGANPDSTQIGDGTEILQINTDGAAEVVSRFRNALVATPETVGTTAVQLVSAAQSERQEVRICNGSKRDIYIGGANTVSAVNGYPLAPGSEHILPAGSAVEVWAIGEIAGQDVRVLEGA